MENDEKGIYKSEGQIRFKIEKFSEFSQAQVGTERQSDLVFVRGLPWHILVINREYKRFRHLDYFLSGTADNSGFILLDFQNLMNDIHLKID